MERIIKIWEKELEPEQKEGAELIINGNNLEFYSRFDYACFPTTYIGKDQGYCYKFFSNGLSKPGINCLLKDTHTHQISYLLRST